MPPGLRIEHLRLDTNLGGAGGFNAGMARVLSGNGLSARFQPPDFLWLLDSDVRVTRRCLRELVRVLLHDDQIAAAGSSIADTITHEIFEVGGRVNRWTGLYSPARTGTIDRRKPVKSDYVAACSTLVRREAIERTGLFPEVFINGDDVEWFVRMGIATGKRIVGVARSKVYHPKWGRKFQTWFRYYASRNCYAPIDALGLGGGVRFRRACIDVLRAFAQTMMGMDELAELHLQGMEDAAAGQIKGFGPRGGIAGIAASINIRPFAELADVARDTLARANTGPGWSGRLFVHPLLIANSIDFPGLEEQLNALGVGKIDTDRWEQRGLRTNKFSDTIAAAWRFIFDNPADVAIVPTGWPTAWFRGRVLLQVTTDGFFLREIKRSTRLKKGIGVIWRGLCAATKLAMRTARVSELPPAPIRARESA